jgi:hypothetical protein
MKILILFCSSFLICTTSIAQKFSKNFCNGLIPSYDTLTVNGNFVRYQSMKDSFIIEYGNKNFKRFLPDKYDCDIADAHMPTLRWENKNFIGLGYGCGNPCSGIIVLPLNSNDNIKWFMYVLAYDFENNLIVYLGNEDYDKLVIENLRNGKRRLINFEDSCSSAFWEYCIDSISISDKELYYRIAEPNRFDKNKKLKEYRIKF